MVPAGFIGERRSKRYIGPCTLPYICVPAPCAGSRTVSHGHDRAVSIHGGRPDRPRPSWRGTTESTRRHRDFPDKRRVVGRALHGLDPLLIRCDQQGRNHTLVRIYSRYVRGACFSGLGRIFFGYQHIVGGGRTKIRGTMETGGIFFGNA
jgi:hypothetical protein